MRFKHYDLQVPERIDNPYADHRTHRIKPAEINLPVRLRWLPGRKIIARLVIEALRPAILSLLRYSVEMGRDLIDRVERDAEGVLDDIADQIEAKL